MKRIKIIITSLLLFAFIGCSDDDRETNFVDNTPPSNVDITFLVTQDNTGLVSLTPSGEGVAEFDVYLGDGTETAVTLNPGESVENIYAEGTYEVKVIAKSINGITTEITRTLVVSFTPPQNLEVTIINDPVISKKVNIVADAEYAVSYEVNFGENEEGPIISANIGDEISHTYQEAGIYTITVTAMGAAIETTTYTEDFEVTAIEAPLASAPTPPARADGDVISIFSSAYTDVVGTNYFPDWGQASQGSSWAMFNLNGDDMLQYVNLSYQGIALADGVTIDVSGMEYLHLDVWTAEDVTDIETSLINNASGTVTEAPVTTSLNAVNWTSIEIPISDYTDQGLTVTEIFQLKFVGTPWAAGTVFIDNIYFYKQPSGPTGLAGIWKMAPEAGALGVGPAEGDISWWNCDAACVAARACYYDDLYVFANDGTFANILGSESWIEGWQGGGDSCGAPVAPHNGSVDATYTYNEVAGTITINGAGAYIGLPKANNQGELPNVAVPNSITYNVTFIDTNNILVTIEAGSGVWWNYKLTRDIPVTPLDGVWKMAPEAGALGVGPAQGDISWWNCDAACVAARSCYYNDLYVFSNGVFSNALGSDSWIEGWQGGGDSCGAPVAPHNGSNDATYTYNSGAGTVTINGAGSYIGLPKANNQGELPNVSVPSSITYNVTFIDSNTINVNIEAGSGVWWQYKLIKF